MENELENARKKINETDKEMARLFLCRMKEAEKIAEYKNKRGLPVKDSAREEELIKRNCDEFPDDEIKPYYAGFLRSVIDVSCSYQEKLLSGAKIAFGGDEGAFAFFAVKKIFPSGIPVPCVDFDMAYKAAADGECDFAVLPLENSYAGEVGAVTDMIFSGSLFINGIYDMAVTQSLLGVKGSRLSDIKKVISHKQALSQCDEFIQKHGFQTEEENSTATAAKRVAAIGDKSVAAIASDKAGDYYGLTVLEKEINESRTNTTRFAVLSRTENTLSATGRNGKFCLVFTVKNEAGSLARAISIIGGHGYNMRTLRSRPMKNLLWQYYFYIEAEGAVRSSEGREMLKELSVCCDMLRVAGTFD